MGERPEWMVPGAAVVEFTSGRTGGQARLVPTTIDRVLKRDVVLANGNRFNADWPRKSNGTWVSSTELLSAGDVRVATAQRANREAEAFQTAWYECDALKALLRQQADDGAIAERTATLVAALDHLSASRCSR